MKVDESTKTATITVKGDGATISDGLSMTSDKQAVSATAGAVATFKAENDAILKLIEDASAKFATATDANDASLRALFEANSFLSLGENLDGFLRCCSSTGQKNVSVEKFVTQAGKQPRTA